MKNLFDSKWLLLVHTLPITVLLGIWYYDYQIVTSFMNGDSNPTWLIFAGALGLLWIMNLTYIIFSKKLAKEAPLPLAIVNLTFHSLFLYLCSLYNFDIIPWSIPGWMYTDNFLSKTSTFVMPTLIYSLFVIVGHFTSNPMDRSVWKNIGYALAIPFIWFITFNVLTTFWNGSAHGVNEHILMVLGILSIILFLFFSVRAIFILIFRGEKSWKPFELLWKGLFAIILPFLGLTINAGGLGIGYRSDAVFGDFSDPWYFILAVLNGIFICLPNKANKPYRLVVFVGRSILFMFTFYFFITFLPLLPIATVLIIAIGLGLLMLTPIILFFIHSNEIKNDYQFLQTHFSKTKLRIIFLAALFVLPTIITMDYVRDRHVFNQVLEYVYSPDYKKTYEFDYESIEYTINTIQRHKRNHRGGTLGINKPFLTNWYSKIVFDNKTLSNAKIDNLKSIFKGSSPRFDRPDQINNQDIHLTDVSTSTTYDAEQNAWRTWVDLELTNTRADRGFGEYATTIELPTGAWICDYYLFVGKKKEMGQLREKKSALWIYNNLRNRRIDPGILYYLTDNKVALRVFPFAQNEVRKTGIEILHRESLTLNIDDREVHLDIDIENAPSGFEHEDLVYLTTEEKMQLPLVQRIPYFHFLIDATDVDNLPHYIDRMDSLANLYPHLAEKAKISLIDDRIQTDMLHGKWRKELPKPTSNRGFFLSRGIEKVLFDACSLNLNSYPIMVAVTDQFDQAILSKDFKDWTYCFPENDHFYHLRRGGILTSHSLIAKPKHAINLNANLNLTYEVRQYTDQNGNSHFISPQMEPALILKTNKSLVNENEIVEKNWLSALYMHAKFRQSTLHPNETQDDWRNDIISSFKSKVMSPLTSYIVVETDVQRAALLKQQEKMLSGNKLLDPEGDIESMSEPGFLVMTFLALLFLFLHRKKTSKVEIG